MPRRNRVDPWGDLHAVSARGLLTGNRGCIVDEREQVVRHHRSSTLWITCLTEFRDWRVPLARPNRWTPIFFLDDAVALAAGHRPCATCRRDMYRSYRDAVDPALRAVELDRRLTTERLRRGSGINRGRDRKTWRADLESLPDGTVIIGADAGATREFRGEIWRPEILGEEISWQRHEIPCVRLARVCARYCCDSMFFP
jgi:hypothetical protein